MPNGVLTWRDVAAPDFRPAMEGFQNFSSAFNAAIGSARSGLKEYDQTATDAVNKAFAADIAMQDGDPAAYAAHKAALIAGTDLSRLSMENLTAADAKFGQLQQRKLTDLNITDTQGNMVEKDYTRGREHKFNDAKDGAAPLLANYYAAAASRDETKTRAIEASPEFQSAMAALGPDEFASVHSKALGLMSGELGYDSSKFNFGKDKTEYAHLLSDRADSDAVDNAMPGLINESTSMSDFQAAVNRNTKLSPSQRLMALERSGKYTSFIDLQAGGGADIGGSLGGLGSAVDPANSVGTGRGYEAVVGYGKYGAPSTPITSMSMGELVDFGRSTLIPRTKAAGVGKAANGQILGSSAAGAYQITGSTLNEFAPRVLGANWKSLPFSAENQDKVAEAIFNSARGSAKSMMGRWESIKTIKQADDLRHLPWSQARQVILAGEGGNPGYTPAQARQAAAGGQAGVALSENGNRITEVIDLVNANPDKNATSQSLARQMVGRGGDFEGGDSNVIRQHIDEFANKYHVNSATAAAALRRSIGDPGSGRYWTRGILGSGFVENTGRVDGHPIDIDYRRLDVYGNALKDKTAYRAAAAARQSRSDTVAQATAAPAALQAAEQRVLILQNAMAHGRAVGPQLAEANATYQRIAAQARAAGEAALAIP